MVRLQVGSASISIVIKGEIPLCDATADGGPTKESSKATIDIRRQPGLHSIVLDMQSPKKLENPSLVVPLMTASSKHSQLNGSTFMHSQTQNLQGMVFHTGEIRVLIVDDDDDLRTALSENLRMNGMVVRAAANGAVFREALRLDRTDVAIIDINLPDASGFDLARELSAKPGHPGVILLTARAERNDRLQGYLEGADIYMTKPVDNDELVLVVRNLSSRLASTRPSSQPRQPSKPGWKLDVARKLLISPDDRIVLLSGREAMLMELFEKANGAALSRTYIASVMGYGEPGPEHRGFDAALRRLKDKAAQAQVEIPLLSVKSMGIRFVAALTKTD